MILPVDVYNTFLQCAQKFPHKFPDGTSNDDHRREAMRKAVGTIRARHGLNWTTKSEHNTGWANQSADALAYVPDNPIHGKRMDMYIWDLVNGTTFEPQYTIESEDLRPAYVLIPGTKDWLAGSQPPPDPIPEPNKPVEVSQESIDKIADTILERLIPVVLTSISELQTELDKFKAEMDNLTFEGRNRILGTITLARKK